MHTLSTYIYGLHEHNTINVNASIQIYKLSCTNTHTILVPVWMELEMKVPVKADKKHSIAISDDEVPLPEDTELRCFQPIEMAHRYVPLFCCLVECTVVWPP